MITIKENNTEFTFGVTTNAKNIQIYLPKTAESPAACCAGWIAEIAQQSSEVYLADQYTA
jgi:hypothetical protein